MKTVIKKKGGSKTIRMLPKTSTAADIKIPTAKYEKDGQPTSGQGSPPIIFAQMTSSKDEEQLLL